MISRYTGAILGLLAFSASIIAGLVARNPASVILSRAVFALVLFCIIGLVVGGAAQFVIDDYARRRYKELLPEPSDEDAAPTEEGESTNSSTQADGQPMGTGVPQG
jgi:hypothetical protein